jgi:hypothetical protein
MAWDISDRTSVFADGSRNGMPNKIRLDLVKTVDLGGVLQGVSMPRRG